jgi:hypothetical protein
LQRAAGQANLAGDCLNCGAASRQQITGNSRKLKREGAFSMGMHRALLGVGAIALAGCGMSEGAGSFLIDPGRYAAYHCNELAARWSVLVAREKELHGLMDKAGEGGGGGAVIGSLAYRTDYDSVLGEERLLQRAAADKNCGFKPEFQSDQTIR